jgi:hypothetical protein
MHRKSSFFGMYVMLWLLLLPHLFLCVYHVCQTVERALALFNHEHILNLITDSIHVILPILFASLYQNATLFWNQYVSIYVIYLLFIIHTHMHTQEHIWDVPKHFEVVYGY